MKESEYQEYEASLNAYRDIKNSVDWAHIKGKAEGKTEGIIEGKIEVAMKLIEMGMDNEVIEKSTGLSINEIEKLKGNTNI